MIALRLAAMCLALSLTGAMAATTQPLHPMVVLLPKGQLNKPYPTSTFLAGGTPPYSIQMQGSLPKGMSISSAAALYGTPREAGVFHFKLDFTDSAGATLELAYALQISR